MPEDDLFEIETMLPQREVADHEVFLSFVRDDDAYAFNDWLQGEGGRAFEQFLQRQRAVRSA